MAFRHTRFQGAILDGTRVLLIEHHSIKTGLKYWVMPGGGIEPDESEIKCVQREMKEETGLDVDVVRLAVDLLESPGRLYTRKKTFLCSIAGGRLAPGDEPEVDQLKITDTSWLDLATPEQWSSMLTGKEWVIPLLWELRIVLGLGQWPGHLTRRTHVPPFERHGPGGLTIERGSPRDSEAWLVLMREVVREMEHEGIPQWSEAYPGPSEFATDVASGTLAVARDQGSVVGSITACESHPAAYRQIEWRGGTHGLVLHRLAVALSHRGRGVGRELLWAAQDFARGAGYSSCRLDVAASNLPARSLYESEGYTEVARLPLWGSDAVCYELAL